MSHVQVSRYRTHQGYTIVLPPGIIGDLPDKTRDILNCVSVQRVALAVPWLQSRQDSLLSLEREQPSEEQLNRLLDDKILSLIHWNTINFVVLPSLWVSPFGPVPLFTILLFPNSTDECFGLKDVERDAMHATLH